MSPSSYDEDRAERVINGPRPSPLQINKHSNVIQKPSIHHRKLPIIIYVHSPKIIHTQPSDFMALVQKLTGFMHQSDDDDRISNELSTDQNSISNNNFTIRGISHEKKEPSLNVADEMHDKNGDVREASSSLHPTTRSRNWSLLEDFPLYTPYYSGDHVLRYSEMVFQSPKIGNTVIRSPSSLEVMKDLSQY